jgi:Flp pilus assembly protein TadG
MFRNSAKHVRSFARGISRFAGARGGTSAVEFGLIAAPFLATLIAILEVTIYLFAQQVLQNAASEAGRLFMTGSAQNSFVQNGDNTTAKQLAQFNSDVCPMISALFNCNNLMVNVSSYSDFTSANASEPALTFNGPNGSGGVANTWSFTPGTPGQVMVVQLIYQWPIVSGPLGYVLSSLGNGHTEIMGVSAFRVEPY